jgi:hypothetical protein
VVSDVPVDDEAPVVTSRIFRSAGAQSFGGAHRGRVRDGEEQRKEEEIR